MEIHTPKPKPEEVIVYTFVSTTGQRHSIDVYPEQGDTVEPVVDINGVPHSLVFSFPRIHLTETIHVANNFRSSVEKQSRLYLDPKTQKEMLLEYLKNEQTKRTKTLPAPVADKEETVSQKKRIRKTSK